MTQRRPCSGQAITAALVNLDTTGKQMLEALIEKIQAANHYAFDDAMLRRILTPILPALVSIATARGKANG